MVRQALRSHLLLSALAVAALFGPGAPEAHGDLLVGNNGSNSVLRFDETTGDLVGTFASGGGLSLPYGLTCGPDNNLYVSSYYGSAVLRYDGSSGAFIDIFASGGPAGGLTRPIGLVFGPDGHLYVSSHAGNSVRRYHGTTGVFIDLFVPANSGVPPGIPVQTLSPTGLVFGPGGDLYVAGSESGRVYRYDGITGDPKGVAGDPADATFVSEVDEPWGLVFGPDDNLYVCAFEAGGVERFDGTTGAPMGTFASGGGLFGPIGLVFGPDDNLYVTSWINSMVLRYDGHSGVFMDVFASGGGLFHPVPLTFQPSTAVAVDGPPAVTRTRLEANSPNPFNPSTAISYSLSSAGHVELAVYDIAGRLVETLVNEEMPAGVHEVMWDGTDVAGHRVSTGVYLYRLRAGNFSETRRMVLLK